MELREILGKVHARARLAFWHCLHVACPSRSVTCCFAGGLKMRFRVDDEIGRHIYTGGGFEHESCLFVQKAVTPGSVAVDLGANIGQFTVLLARAVGPSGKVYAFEPSPRERQVLSENVRLNGFSNVVVEGFAVGERDGDGVLHLAHPSQSGFNALGDIHRQDLSSGERTQVEVVAFDSYWERKGMPRLDFIKVDVEGSELKFLEGAARTLGRYRPTLLMEFSDLTLAKFNHRTRDLRAALDRLGYELFALSRAGDLLPDPGFRECEYMNMVARPRGWPLGDLRGARLHLGCGGNRLAGYVNIDTASSGNQPSPECDLEADFTALSLPPGSVAEIRLHHVFEHFRKGEAAGLLARFNQWLGTGGLLWIEVPDLTDTTLYYFLTGDLRAVRHLAGSQEAPWATHHELWDGRQLRRALELFGFGHIELHRNRAWFRRSRRKWWCNLTVKARKERTLDMEEARRAAEALFEPYLINREIELPAWLGHFDTMMGRGHGP